MGLHCEITPPPLAGARDCHRSCKNLSFCEMSNNPTPLYVLLDPLKNEHCWAWSYMVNYLIDSRTGENHAVKLTMLYLEVLIIWSRKILQKFF